MRKGASTVSAARTASAGPVPPDFGALLRGARGGRVDHHTRRDQV